VYKDYTIKARLYSSKEIENTLSRLNSKFIGVDLQTDTYFETSRGKLKLRHGTIENLITHYERTQEGNVEKTHVYRYDVNPTKEEIEKLKTSHRTIGSVEKERKIYFINHIKIHLDKLENKDEYIEIEAIDRQNLFSNEELKRQCLEVKEKLGIRESDIVQTGYLKL
jgi:predicted adenylyl cyclase CyaB